MNIIEEKKYDLMSRYPGVLESKIGIMVRSSDLIEIGWEGALKAIEEMKELPAFVDDECQ